MQVSYTICSNHDNLTRQENAIHNPLVTRTYHSKLDVAALKNEILMRCEEYQIKLESASKMKQMYKCHDCPYSTIWSYNLRRHEKAMYNPSSVYKRKLEVASEKKMYKCRECPYSTNWLSNVRPHQNFHHKPIIIKKIYKCQDCSYSTNLQYNLRRHKNTMHNQTVTQYQKKLELGRAIKQIVHEHNVPIASLDKENMGALQLFESHVQDKHCE